MLEVGRVVHAGREHHHRRVVAAARRDAAQGLQQQVGVVRDGRHGMQGEQLREQPHHHLAVLEHVGHAAGHAQVVLEHVVVAGAVGVAGAHDVDARDVRVHVARHVHADHLGTELRVVDHLVARHDAGLQDLLVVVDVVDEPVERQHPLGQALFHVAPLVRRDDARDLVERDQALGALAGVLVAIHRERDADPPEDQFGLVPAIAHQVGRLPGQPLRVVLVVLTHRVARGVHLIERQIHGELCRELEIR